ncbi:bactofilin family protein [Kiloniella sp. b19]|uniref:bactofilin family protein n=1 Tax=Kiloniella sp. GXU_MW_B19 TaxID=3141326 RepID=UPI0031DE1E87
MTSIFSNDLVIEGDVHTKGDLQLDGTVVGDLSGERIIVGQDGRVQGGIKARSVRVLGSVSGNINAENVYIAETARIDGDIVHEVLSIESGAHVHGRMIRAQDADAKEGQTPLQIAAAQAEKELEDDSAVVHSAGWTGENKEAS